MAATLGGHPHTQDKFRWRLARHRLSTLIFGLVALLGLLAAAMAVLFELTESGAENHDYGYWVKQTALSLAGFDTRVQEETDNEWRWGAQFVTALSRLIVPALALGIVVFKAFVYPSVFRTRDKLSVTFQAGAEALVFRFYSTTRLELMDVAFRVFARVNGTSDTGSPTVTNAELTLKKDHWPVALPHVPYFVYAVLEDGDRDPHTGKLTGIQGNDISAGCNLMLSAQGQIPALGTDFIETHWWDTAEAIEYREFGEVDVNYPENRRTWKVSTGWPGWGSFDSPSRKELVEHALSYPYDQPAGSYVWVKDHAVELLDVELGSLADSRVKGGDGGELSLGDYCASVGVDPEVLGEPRTPVLTYGSNSSTETLRRKFTVDRATTVVPVIRALLHDFDVVYSAHISRYGSIAAALQRSPGTVVSAYVLMVSESLLAELNRTEPNYDYRRIDGVRLEVENDPDLDSVHTYVSKHGCLTVEGSLVAVAAIPARDRAFQAMTEAEVLAHVHQSLAPDMKFDEFVEQNVLDPDLAYERTLRLHEGALPLDWEVST